MFTLLFFLDIYLYELGRTIAGSEDEFHYLVFIPKINYIIFILYLTSIKCFISIG